MLNRFRFGASLSGLSGYEDRITQKISSSSLIFTIAKIFSLGLTDLSNSDLGKLDPLPPCLVVSLLSVFLQKYAQIGPLLHLFQINQKV